MAQNEILHDFSSFNSVEEKEIFLKNLIRKQLELSKTCFLADPTSQNLHQHTQLMGQIYNSNFHKILASRLNTPVSINQFATIFSEVLDEQLEIVLTN